MVDHIVRKLHLAMKQQAGAQILDVTRPCAKRACGANCERTRLPTIRLQPPTSGSTATSVARRQRQRMTKKATCKRGQKKESRLCPGDWRSLAQQTDARKVGTMVTQLPWHERFRTPPTCPKHANVLPRMTPPPPPNGTKDDGATICNGIAPQLGPTSPKPEHDAEYSNTGRLAPRATLIRNHVRWTTLRVQMLVRGSLAARAPQWR